MLCEHGYGRCTAPETKCPYWQGTFCALDLTYNSVTINNYNCYKCVYELECQDNPINCKKYKYDPPVGDNRVR